MEITSRVGVKVETASDQPGAAARIRVETDLPGDLLLHWGVVPRGARADMWTIPAPAMRPEGSNVFGDRAVQSPMHVVKGGMVGDFRYTELDMGSAPGGVRFVIKEQGGRDRWFDNYGGDFVVPLPEQALSSSLLKVGVGTLHSSYFLQSKHIQLMTASSMSM
jgi:alpha-amylase